MAAVDAIKAGGRGRGCRQRPGLWPLHLLPCLSPRPSCSSAPPFDPQLPPLAFSCLGILRAYATTHPEWSPVLPRVGGLEPQRLPGVGSWCLHRWPVSF